MPATLKEAFRDPAPNDITLRTIGRGGRDEDDSLDDLVNFKPLIAHTQNDNPPLRQRYPQQAQQVQQYPPQGRQQERQEQIQKQPVQQEQMQGQPVQFSGEKTPLRDDISCQQLFEHLAKCVHCKNAIDRIKREGVTQQEGGGEGEDDKTDIVLGVFSGFILIFVMELIRQI